MKRYLLHRRTAVVVIVAFTIICCIALFIPQRDAYSVDAYRMWTEQNGVMAPFAAFLQLDTIFTSYMFFALVAISWIAVSFSVWNGLKLFRKKNQRNDAALIPRKDHLIFSFPVVSDGLADAAARVGRQFGFTRFIQKENGYQLFRNIPGRYGSTILHAGFVLLIAAALGTYMFQKKGFIQLIERDTFFGWQTEMLSEEHGIFADRFVPDILLSLDTFTPEYYPSGSVKALSSSVLSARQGDAPVRGIVAVNHPLVVDGVSIYQTTSFGYAVGLVLEQSGDAVQSYFCLDAADSLHTIFAGSSDYPSTEFDIEMEYRNGVLPQLYVVIRKNGSIVSSGSLRRGEFLNVGDGRLSFVDARQWTGFILTENPFVAVAFVSFALILAGIVMLYLFPYGTIDLRLQTDDAGTTVTVEGYAEREKGMFRIEYDDFVKELFVEKGVHRARTELVED